MQVQQNVEAFNLTQVEKVQKTICIEFVPTVHHLDDYPIPKPAFTFCEEVALREQYDYCIENNINFADEFNIFRISALELVEYRSKNGVLTTEPYWVYGIRYVWGTRELNWFEEDELARPLTYSRR